LSKIKIAIAGLGNCSSSLIQGIQYYKNKNEKDAVGLMHFDIGGYRPFDIEVVAALDIDKRKVGKYVSDAIFELPNCTKIFCDNIPEIGVKVMKGPVLDGVAPHMIDYFQVDENQQSVDVTEVLKESNAEILINYLPVGSQRATEYYAQCAIDAECGFINCIPVFVASTDMWAEKFRKANLPIIGDDVKSQVGSTITNRYLIQMLIDRGAKIDSIYQTNIGGNTDFRNMTDPSRLTSKKISKTESISSLIPYDIPIFAGPNGCIDNLKDNKISYMRIDFRIFGDIQCCVDLKLSVEDSPNSGGIIIDAIRMTKIALDKGIGGVLTGPSAWSMKHPLVQYPDNISRQMTEDFINIS
jgi:myo-inositol-1-phosphate synthase